MTQDDVFDLTNDMELGKMWSETRPDELRQHLIECFHKKIYTGRQCAKMFDDYNLWPSLDEIFENFVIGYLSRQSATEATGSHSSIFIPNHCDRSLTPVQPPYMAEISAYPAGGER